MSEFLMRSTKSRSELFLNYLMINIFVISHLPMKEGWLRTTSSESSLGHASQYTGIFFRCLLEILVLTSHQLHLNMLLGDDLNLFYLFKVNPKVFLELLLQCLLRFGVILFVHRYLILHIHSQR